MKMLPIVELRGGAFSYHENSTNHSRRCCPPPSSPSHNAFLELHPPPLYLAHEQELLWQVVCHLITSLLSSE
jgi:hypothetical protein